MRILILTSLIFSTACAKETEYVAILPDIPAETLTPCPISDRQVRTVNELAALATEHLRSAECGNSKLSAIAQILSAFREVDRNQALPQLPAVQLSRHLVTQNSQSF